MMAKVLGITGGIGSGKTYVSRIFASLGCKVYDSDSRTKELYQEDEWLLEKLGVLLGDAIFAGPSADGRKRLDKKAMASIIFSNKDLMEKVKELVYPVVMKDFVAWKKWKRGVVVFESAVILENEYVHSFMDRTLVITAPEEVRINRVMKRDGSTYTQVKARLDNQISDSERIAKSDFVMESASGADLEEQARRILFEMNCIKK